MSAELEDALASKGKLIGPGDLPANYTASQIHTALGYQAKGLEFVKNQTKGQDLTPLLTAPHILHAAPMSVAAGTKFDLCTDPVNTAARQQVEFCGFGKSPAGDIELTFKHEGNKNTFYLEDPNAVAGAKVESGPRKADPSNPNELAAVVPGEVLLYSVNVGDKLEEGKPMLVMESMKMEVKISVPAELDGKEVVALSCKGRTKTAQGDLVTPGALLLEVK